MKAEIPQQSIAVLTDVFHLIQDSVILSVWLFFSGLFYFCFVSFLIQSDWKGCKADFMEKKKRDQGLGRMISVI